MTVVPATAAATAVAMSKDYCLLCEFINRFILSFFLHMQCFLYRNSEEENSEDLDEEEVDEEYDEDDILQLLLRLDLHYSS